MTEGTAPVTVHAIERVGDTGVNIVFHDHPVLFDQGRFTTILGQNGSGKTTLLEAILVIRTDYSVRRDILGSNHMDLPNNIKKRIGVSTQVHDYSEGVTVRDIVRLHAGAYGAAINAELLDLLDMNETLGSTYAKISGGQEKRLSLYFALAHDPDVAFLDEPEAGLDVQGLEALIYHIKERTRHGKTTVAATHHSMTTDSASNVVFLDAGEIAYAGSKSRFVEQYLDDSVLEIDTSGLSEQAVKRISRKGKANSLGCFGDGKLLLFGSSTMLGALREKSEMGIKPCSILRKIKPTDVMAWINTRKVVK